MKDLIYKVVIEPQEEGGFTAYVPKLPGCVSEGDTYDETMENIKEALQLYLEVMKERNLQILNDDIRVTEVCVAL
jgi:predicted RNase H-like HicB family nuclease